MGPVGYADLLAEPALLILLVRVISLCGPSPWNQVWVVSAGHLPYFCQMRTTLDIDDDLMRALEARLPAASKTEAIETAIANYVRQDAARGLIELAGTLAIEDVSPALRQVDRHS